MHKPVIRHARHAALVLTAVAACGTSFGQAASGLVQYRMEAATVVKATGLPAERFLHLALSNPSRPDGAQATQTIPATLGLGASLSLQNAAAPATGMANSSAATGNVLLYWGCGDAVREGQPQTISANTQVAVARAGYPSDALPAGSAHWPAMGTAQAPIAATASLVGPHAVSGEGIPAGLQFAVPAAQDFMPALAVTAQGGEGKALSLEWGALPTATATFWMTSAARAGDTVVWTSSELATTGAGMLDFHGAADVGSWLASKVVLPPAQTRCAIPPGVLQGTDGARVQGIAYGPELRLARNGEWSARLRAKSLTTLELDAKGKDAKAAQDKPLTPAIPGVPNLSGALKGLLGR